MDDLFCKKHDRNLKCLSGESAHIDNWYCPECDGGQAATASRQAKLDEKDKEIAKANIELEKWRRPYDQERFDAIKEQAEGGHSKSLAAMRVYITSLEHTLKLRDAEINKLDAANAKIVAQQARIAQLHCALEGEIYLSDDEYTFEDRDYSLNVISTTNDLSALADHDKAKESKLDALEAENARLKAALNSQWQPIETAPKDGKYYLFYRTSEIQSAIWLGDTWGDDGWCYQLPENIKNGFTDSLPTHWMTLPEAPIARDALKGK